MEDVNENEKSSTTKTLIIIHKFLESLLINDISGGNECE